MQKCIRSCWFAASSLQQRADLLWAGGLLGEVEGAGVTHFVRGSQQCSQRGACEGAAHADPFDSDGRELGQTQLNTAQSHHDVYRAIDRAHDRGDVVPGSQPGSIEYVCSSVLIDLQSCDRVFKVGAPVQVILRTRRQRERERQRACGHYRGANSVRRKLDIVDGIVRPLGRIFDRSTNCTRGRG